ncbi:DMT family transporter [Fibrella arboris]|uniref:DMT family transporter n=1 Tax=Fibrella arboris TaxID=3242486 RepID=UPI0035209548
MPTSETNAAKAPPASQRMRYWIGAVCVFLAAFCFAMKGIMIKLAYQDGVDALSLLTLRMLFSLPFYVGTLLWLARRVPHVQMAPKQWGLVALFGIMGYYVASYLNFVGLAYIDASLERVLLFTYPTFVLLLNAFLVKRPVASLQWVALALTYSGIMIAFLPHLAGSNSAKTIWLGAGWVILSGLVYALYLVGSDSMIARLGAQRYTCYAMLAATVPTVLHKALATGLDLSNFPVSVYIIGLSMALVNTVLPTFLIAEGIKRVGSANTALIGSIGPIFTVMLASSVLGEHISEGQVIGTVFVLTGVLLIGLKGEKSKR